jgi:Calcineurin-like phosphoesterase
VQKAVRDAYERRTGIRRTDLVLALGDNAYSGGTDAQYQRAFFDIYRDLFKHSVLWPAMGNHDARSADSATESGVYYQLNRRTALLGKGNDIALQPRRLFDQFKLRVDLMQV